MRFRATCLILLCGILLCGPFPADAARIGPRLEAVLASPRPPEKTPVIVSFRSQADRGPKRPDAMARALRSHSERSQQGVRELLARQGKGYRDLWIANSLAIDASAALIQALARHPEVASVRLDATIEAPRVVEAAFSLVQNLQAVRAPDLWAMGYTGRGVVIATLDSGVDLAHPDLGDRWRGGADDWFNPYARQCDAIACTACEANATFPCDDESGDERGHGTAVAGVLVGGDSTGEAIGVAPGARWIAAKVFRDDGTASLSFIHEAFQWVLENPAPPDLVNASWALTGASGECSLEFQPDIEVLNNAGIEVVFAAANTGPEPASSQSPGNNAGAFAVGATGTENSIFEIASFSARGPSACDGSIYPEAVAPGFHVRSADTEGGVTVFSGTSFSAPHAAGVMALLLEAFPGLPHAELEAAVLASAEDLGPAGPDNTYGFGFVNALAAFQFLEGNPDLFLRDPVLPNNDRLLDFGSVAVGSSAEQVVELRNNGSGLLLIDALDTSTLQPPFTVAADSCGNATLAAAESCTISLRFAPSLHQSFAGRLGIFSNDPDEPAVEFSVRGAGNRPPAVPQLIAPEDGAVDLSAEVTFRWIHPEDPDGDTVTDTLLVSRAEDFTDTLPVATAGSGPAPAALAAGGILLAGLAGWRRRRRNWLFLILLLALLALFQACGGGGGGGGGDTTDDQTPPSVNERTGTVTGLEPATEYHWKVVASDALGGTAESPVRTFRTR